jgi:cytochrome P450/pimeloyl-ACP methyl ester carboxylesterase
MASLSIDTAAAEVVADVERRARRFETPCGDGVMVWRAWGSGPPVLLAHGSHGGWSHWIRNIDALAATRTVWAPDLPGYGGSAMAERADQGAIADALALGLRELIGPKLPLDVIGFSFGGVACAHLAANHPELVRRLIIVGSGGLDTPVGQIEMQRLRGLEGEARREALRANLLALMLHHPESADELALHLQVADGLRARLDPSPLVLPDKLLEALPRITAQIDAIWGEHDRPHPVAAGQEAVLRRFQPELEFRVIADAGHWAMYERPEAFNRTLIELLDQPLRTTSFADLDFAELPMAEAWFAEDPARYFAEARQRHPWLAKWKFGPVVIQYEAVRDLIRMEPQKMRMPYDQLVQIMEAQGTPWGRFQEGHILSYSGAAHTRLRDILAPAFTPRQANLHRPLMREVIGKLLDDWAPRRAFDFEEFASYFPVTVMFELIGADPALLPEIRASLEAMGLSVSLETKYMPAIQQATVELDDFVHRLMDVRVRGERLRETPDLLDVLLAAKDAGGLSERELADLLIFLFVAGFDTSKNVLTLAMYQLLERPEMYARCAEDLAYSRKVIDETMRYHSVTTTNRLLTEDLVYRDVRFPKGTSIWFPWAMIGRDPAAAEDPDAFDPDRAQKNPHMGFALGAHMCLGQFIARAQLEEGLRLIAQRITRPRSPGPLGWRPFPGVWGVRGLPIEFAPADAPIPETQPGSPL